jgi:cysteine desulfurase / selenocysteine lyase
VQDGLTGDEVKARLAEQKMTVWVSPVSSTRIDLEARGLSEVVRASVHYYNTEAEIAALVDAIRELAARA